MCSGAGISFKSSAKDVLNLFFQNLNFKGTINTRFHLGFIAQRPSGNRVSSLGRNGNLLKWVTLPLAWL